ncbi:MAG: oligopeptide transport ATP-binding protein OppF [Frankiales bacterium]|jgi:oligopeptide transport system ATP-binding protein|nr:oligopeptide transport ATP-binding protein OppF [Frankiales bacterium]
MALLEVAHLVKEFRSAGRPATRAADDLSFTVEQGRTLALVGESGAGKSTVGRLVLRLVEPDSGSLTFDGRDLRALGGRALRRERRWMQMVFQDPYGSLDPRVPIGESVAEPLLLHTRLSRSEREEQAAALLVRVGLPTAFLHRFPSQLSGGQLQRVSIARALTLEPKLLVCDEPTAALDVSIQAQVLELLRELQHERDLAYLFISHDLALVHSLAHEVAVMQRGAFMEKGTTEQVFADPQHSYTRDLLAAMPRLAVGQRSGRGTQ